MLKTIRDFPKHRAVIQVGRKICRLLYNHNKLHAMMNAAIEDELVK
jgi:hypothetical protein